MLTPDVLAPYDMAAFYGVLANISLMVLMVMCCNGSSVLGRVKLLHLVLMPGMYSALYYFISL
jgi:hypothetical protein